MKWNYDFSSYTIFKKTTGITVAHETIPLSYQAFELTSNSLIFVDNI